MKPANNTEKSSHDTLFKVPCDKFRFPLLNTTRISQRLILNLVIFVQRGPVVLPIFFCDNFSDVWSWCKKKEHTSTCSTNMKRRMCCKMGREISHKIDTQTLALFFAPFFKCRFPLRHNRHPDRCCPRRFGSGLEEKKHPNQEGMSFGVTDSSNSSE